MAQFINRTHFGDCRESMRAMIDAGVKVQTCVTSPPYWGLRDYGVDGQLGREETPDQFVDNLVEVFGLVRDLLADDGTLWLNLGDSFASGGRGGDESYMEERRHGSLKSRSKTKGWKSPPHGLKHKDLVGIPWRVAFALQSDGWYLRQDIIWNKPNPMPESVKDRCTRSHEYIFLMSKSPRYYYDHESIREERTSDEDANGFRDGSYTNNSTFDNHKGGKRQVVGNKKVRQTDKQRGHGRRHAGFNDRWDHMTKEEQAAIGRNKRDVWTVATKGYEGAHFATYPPALITPCILAGSRPGDIVFDPFMGSGTTGQVAQSLGRNWIGCELNPDYEALQRERIQQIGLAI